MSELVWPPPGHFMSDLVWPPPGHFMSELVWPPPGHVRAGTCHFGIHDSDNSMEILAAQRMTQISRSLSCVKILMDSQ